MARLLIGAWRHLPSSEEMSPGEMAAIVPLLHKSGASALGWRRVCNSKLRNSQPAFQLRQAYRLHTIQAAVRDRELVQLSAFLRSNGLEPLLGKGWAAARLYPEPGLRPYTDFDLYLRPEEYETATVALKSDDAPGGVFDLHRGVSELDDRSFDEIFRRSQLAPLGEAKVRVFGPEDHLRLLCLHMFHHGAWRPLWLCDVAVAFETRPANFDWDYFLSGDRKRTDWVVCAIGLAHQMLGAIVKDTPIESRAKQLPRWLIPAILRQWGKGQTPHGARLPLKDNLRSPSGLLEAIRIRWPNPIEATVGVRGPFNEFPRLPFQLGACLARSVRFTLKLPKKRC